MKRTGIKFGLLLAIALFLCGTSAKAQSSIWEIPLHVEAAFEMGTPCHSITPFGANLDLNYSFKSFSLHAAANADFHIAKDGVSSGYNKAINLGGGIGYRFLPCGENNSGGYEARAIVTTTLGSSDFKNTDYKIGIYWIGSYKWRKIVPVVGVGFKLMDYSNAMPTYKGGFVSLGIRF